MFKKITLLFLLCFLSFNSSLSLGSENDNQTQEIATAEPQTPVSPNFISVEDLKKALKPAPGPVKNSFFNLPLTKALLFGSTIALIGIGVHRDWWTIKTLATLSVLTVGIVGVNALAKKIGNNSSPKVAQMQFKFLNSTHNNEVNYLENFGVYSSIEFSESSKKLVEEKLVKEREEQKQKRNEAAQKNDLNLKNDLASNLSVAEILQKQIPRVFVIDFVDEGGDIENELEKLTNYVSFLSKILGSSDEVVVRLYTPGGEVSAYGLAASQLMRLRKATSNLTICVDKVAASGGYMMATVANKIVAAPFAQIGSIGVVVEFPNFARLLDKLGVNFLTITAGENKRSVTQTGENSPEAIEKMKKDLEAIHVAFKGHILKHRPQVAIEKIATGSVWLGTDALALQLVDEISTSAEYIESKFATHDVILISYPQSQNSRGSALLGLASNMNRALKAVSAYLWKRPL